MPELFFCNYSLLSLSLLSHFSSLAPLPSTITPFFFYLIIYASLCPHPADLCQPPWNHHHIRAFNRHWYYTPIAHAHLSVVCVCLLFLNAPYITSRGWGSGGGGFFIPTQLPRVIVAPNKLQRWWLLRTDCGGRRWQIAKSDWSGRIYQGTGWTDVHRGEYYSYIPALLCSSAVTEQGGDWALNGHSYIMCLFSVYGPPVHQSSIPHSHI